MCVARELPNITYTASAVVVSLYVSLGILRSGVCEGHGADVPRAGMCTVGVRRVDIKHYYTGQSIGGTYKKGCQCGERLRKVIVLV